jgi:hypothetical protein
MHAYRAIEEKSMDERERFQNTLHFGNPDKATLDPGHPRESTLAGWHQQGLPEGVHWYNYLMETLGIDHRVSPSRIGLDVTFHMLPAFEEKILDHREGHCIVQDWSGAITEISDEYDFTYLRHAKDFVTRKWHRFPVETREDWAEKIQWRYTPDHAERFPSDFDVRCKQLRGRDHVLRLTVPGPFWQLREWVGFENLCILMINDPEFVEDMAQYWGDFVLKVLARILEQITPDYVQVSEDMAYKLHSMISPAMTQRFLMPIWKKWTSALETAQVPVKCIDSDGYIGMLLPLFIEAGFDCNYPVEVAAGNDIVAYREQFGRRMAYIGGLDKRALAAGGETMRAEIMRVVPALLKEGGFIPSCDHGVPPDISWPNFVEYTKLLAQLTGWL